MDRERIKRFEQMEKDIEQLQRVVLSLLPKERKQAMKSLTVVALIGTILSVGAVFFGLNRAIRISIENQDKMLCSSAQQSGNKEYLKKCQCFYKTNDITCLQREN